MPRGAHTHTHGSLTPAHQSVSQQTRPDQGNDSHHAACQSTAGRGGAGHCLPGSPRVPGVHTQNTRTHTHCTAPALHYVHTGAGRGRAGMTVQKKKKIKKPSTTCGNTVTECLSVCACVRVCVCVPGGAGEGTHTYTHTHTPQHESKGSLQRGCPHSQPGVLRGHAGSQPSKGRGGALAPGRPRGRPTLLIQPHLSSTLQQQQQQR